MNMTSAPHCTAQQLEEKLIKELGATYVKAVDESDGCGSKFSVILVSESFNGKTPLQKHRLVHKALATELEHIHAFSQELYTPADWELRQQEMAKKGT